jgi:hypothetical protein
MSVWQGRWGTAGDSRHITGAPHQEPPDRCQRLWLAGWAIIHYVHSGRRLAISESPQHDAPVLPLDHVAACVRMVVLFAQPSCGGRRHTHAHSGGGGGGGGQWWQWWQQQVMGTAHVKSSLCDMPQREPSRSSGAVGAVTST